MNTNVVVGRDEKEAETIAEKRQSVAQTRGRGGAKTKTGRVICDERKKDASWNSLESAPCNNRCHAHAAKGAYLEPPVMESIQKTFIQNSILNTFLSIQK